MATAKQRSLEAKLDGRKKRAALLCVQREFAEGEESRKSYDQIAEEIGVSRVTLWEWRTQDQNFIDYVNILADDFLASERTLVYRQLMKLIEGPQPSVKGIDLYLRRFGLLTERQVVETKEAGGGSRDNDSIAEELAELDELLTDEKE